MTLPPYFLRVRVQDSGHNIRLWLPLFLLWPLCLFLLVLAIPALLIASYYRNGYIVRTGWQIYLMLCAMRGLKIDVREKNQRVHLELK